MSRASKKRFQEGALRALKTPENVPPPARLVPLSSLPESGGAEAQATLLPASQRVSVSNTRLVEQAVASAQAGDPEGLHFLYVRYSPDVQRYVASIVHDRHAAEDITQNIFAKLMAAIKKYDAREVPFAAWIMRISCNAALDHLRAARSASVEEERMVDPSSSIREALEQLPEDQREVLILRHIAGLSPVEIAATLKKSESSVHGLHHRGRRTLQARLTELDARQHALEDLLRE